MATTEELLKQAEENIQNYSESDEYCMLESETSRVVVVPDRWKSFGVEGDNDTERIKFKFPKIVGDNIDLAQMNMRINFLNANNRPDRYVVDDVETTSDGNYVTFSWLLSDSAMEAKGTVGFVVYASKIVNDVEKRWYTTLNTDCESLVGLRVDEQIVSQYPDIIETLLQRMDDVEAIATPEAMQEYVNQYLTENPIQVDSTLSEKGKAAESRAVGYKIGMLEDELGRTKSGISEETYNIFDCSKIIVNKFINQTVGLSTIDSLSDSDGNFTSIQVWKVKKGDKICCSSGWSTFGIYNSNGILIGIFNDGETEHEITFEDACYMRMSSLNASTYVDKFVLSINNKVKGYYVQYEETFNLPKENSIEIDSLKECTSNIESFNKINPELIFEGKRYNEQIGKSEEDFYDGENYIYCSQKIHCKKGDVVRVSNTYSYITFYDELGHVVECWNDGETKYIVNGSNVRYLRYSCISNDPSYKDYFMLTINNNIPSFYVPFGVSVFDYNSYYKYNVPMLLFTFDDAVPEGDESKIVKLMLNKYGYKFTFNGSQEYAKELIKRGCDLATYSNVSGELPDESTINSDDPDDLEKWDSYVKNAKKRQEDAGFYNPTLWGAHKLLYGTALEYALIKNGYVFCRAGSSTDPIELEKEVPYQKFPCLVPTDTNLDDVKLSIRKLVSRGGVMCILFHKILDAVPDGDTWDISTDYFIQIMDYIKTYVDDGHIKVVTSTELYRHYNTERAIENDYNRIMKMVIN